MIVLTSENVHEGFRLPISVVNILTPKNHRVHTVHVRVHFVL
jgi:hypothetical protein